MRGRDRRARGCAAAVRYAAHIAIIILTMHDNADYLRAAIAAGARGFITKDASREELLKAIDLVAAGGVA